MILNVNSLNKSFGGRTILENASFHIEDNSRIALVGPNGAGKTTLLNIISGQESKDSGDIVFAKGVRLGYLEQESIGLKDANVLEEVLNSAKEIVDLKQELEEVEKHLDSGQASEQETYRLLDRYGNLRSRFEALDGYNLETNARMVLFGLGFNEHSIMQKTQEFSGGWQMRISLAKVLLKAPDLLLLDEPTNHLDLESVAWLESYIRNFKGAILLVSHDRAFLDGMANTIFEIDNCKITTYKGNYSKYML
ncbi:MAG: ATP-binding cassette domain-containing protein [Coriobacteriales bacterium]|nr:ATP-binding cassette domain-containing protein [Coriobacteriales bacterium]